MGLVFTAIFLAVSASAEEPAVPSVKISWPTLAGGYSIINGLEPALASAPTAIVVAADVISSQFTVGLPVAPAVGESLTVTCTPAGSSVRIEAVATRSQDACRNAAPANGACVFVAGAAFGSAEAIFNVVGQFDSAATDGVNCVILSDSLSPQTKRRYAARSELPTMPVTALATSWPQLSAVFLEASGGGFVALNGAASGATLYVGGAAPGALPSVDCPESPVSWSSPGVENCPEALGLIVSDIVAVAVEAGSSSKGASAVLAQYGASGRGAGAQMGAVLERSTHLILVLSPGQPSATLSVSVGGVACVLNWFDAATGLLSITTPSIEALCGGDSGGGVDCRGLESVDLEIWDSAGSDPLDPSSRLRVTSLVRAASLLAAAGAAPDTLPVIPIALRFPPSRPLSAAGWSGAAGRVARAVGGALLSAPVDARAAILSPSVSTPGVGIFVASPCTDPENWAPADECSLGSAAWPSGGFGSRVNTARGAASGLPCPLNINGACSKCPNGAACPGGARALSLAGFWSTLPSSPAQSECPNPDAALRCPGWSATGAALPGVCGSGFAGASCNACAENFADDGTGGCGACAVVEEGGFALVAARASGFFLLACVGVWSSFVTAMRLAVPKKGESAAPIPYAAALGAMAWAWAHASPLVSSFLIARRLFVEREGAGGAGLLSGMFSIIEAMQWSNSAVASPAACFKASASAPAFTGSWVALATGLFFYLILGVTLFAWHKGILTDPAGAIASRAVGLALCVGHAAMTNAFARTAACTQAAALPVSVYVRLRGADGSALGALGLGKDALGALIATLSPSPPPALDAVNTARWASVLASTVSVSTLVTDPGAVCYEGDHTAASYGAAVGLAVIGAGLPLLGAFAWWRVSKLSAAAAPLALSLARALGDTSMQTQHAWLWHAAQAASAVLAAPVALATARATTDERIGSLSGGTAAVCLVALLCFRFTPYAGGSASWRTRFDFGVYSLSVAALISALVFTGGLEDVGKQAADRFGVSIALLVSAALLALGAIAGTALEAASDERAQIEYQNAAMAAKLGLAQQSEATAAAASQAKLAEAIAAAAAAFRGLMIKYDLHRIGIAADEAEAKEKTRRLSAAGTATPPSRRSSISVTTDGDALSTAASTAAADGSKSRASGGGGGGGHAIELGFSNPPSPPAELPARGSPPPARFGLIDMSLPAAPAAVAVLSTSMATDANSKNSGLIDIYSRISEAAKVLNSSKKSEATSSASQDTPPLSQLHHAGGLVMRDTPAMSFPSTPSLAAPMGSSVIFSSPLARRLLPPAIPAERSSDIRRPPPPPVRHFSGTMPSRDAQVIVNNPMAATSLPHPDRRVVASSAWAHIDVLIDPAVIDRVKT